MRPSSFLRWVRSWLVDPLKDIDSSVNVRFYFILSQERSYVPLTRFDRSKKILQVSQDAYTACLELAQKCRTCNFQIKDNICKLCCLFFFFLQYYIQKSKLYLQMFVFLRGMQGKVYFIRK